MKESSGKTDRDLLEDIHERVTRMDHVVFGDEPAKVPGLVGKVHKLEKAEEKRGVIYTFIAAVSSGLTITIIKFIDWLNKN